MKTFFFGGGSVGLSVNRHRMLRIDSEGMDGGKKMEFSLSNDDDIENIEK